MQLRFLADFVYFSAIFYNISPCSSSSSPSSYWKVELLPHSGKLRTESDFISVCTHSYWKPHATIRRRATVTQVKKSPMKTNQIAAIDTLNYISLLKRQLIKN
jgi:hypothetical protein